MDNFKFTGILILLGSVVRFLLGGLAGILVAYGATQEQIDIAVSEATAIIIALVITGVSLTWSYISKKAALEATPPTEER